MKLKVKKSVIQKMINESILNEKKISNPNMDKVWIDSLKNIDQIHKKFETKLKKMLIGKAATIRLDDRDDEDGKITNIRINWKKLDLSVTIKTEKGESNLPYNWIELL